MYDNSTLGGTSLAWEFIRNIPEAVLGLPMLARIGAPIVDATDIQGEERPGVYLEYGEPMVREYELSTDEPAPKPIKQARGTYNIPQPFVKELRDAKLIGPRPLTLTSRGEALATTCGGQPRFVYRAMIDLVADIGWEQTRDLITEPAPQSIDVAFPLVYPVENYAHWTSEYLVKLRALEVYQQECGRTPTVLVNSNVPDWMVETIRIAGYDGEIVEWDGASVSVNRLIVARHHPCLHINYQPSPDHNWLRERMLDTVGATGRSLPKRIFLSRADTLRRRVHNRPQLLRMLSEYGFESVLPAQLDLRDQIRLFADAEMIVAPHGSALQNIIYSSSSKLMILYPPQIDPAFALLAEQMGLDFDFAVGERPPTEEGTDTDFVIDPAEVESKIQNWM